LILNDQRIATFVAASVLTLVLSLGVSAGAVHAAEVIGAEEAAPVVVAFIHDAQTTLYETRARNVGDFLSERNLQIAPDDYLSAPLDATLVDGMRVEYRSAFAYSLEIDGKRFALHGAPATVADVLELQQIVLGRNDEVIPPADSHLRKGTNVRVVRVTAWTANVREKIAPKVHHRFDPDLAMGETRTADPGAAGLREMRVRYVKRDNSSRTIRIVLASRIVQEPRPKVVVHGIGEFVAVSATLGNAMRIAGTAVRMIATAYVPYCSGCSGVTALGLRAGHGIVAVDPNVIPLGTRLYVPGYGTALAGDTGGAIRGNRIDLGFNNLGEALRFGRRAITVFVLR